MERASKRRKIDWKAAGLVALALAACAGCCAPLVAPLVAALFAWSGATRLAAMGQTALAATLFAAGTAGALLAWRRKRRNDCECGGDGGCAAPGA